MLKDPEFYVFFVCLFVLFIYCGKTMYPKQNLYILYIYCGESLSVVPFYSEFKSQFNNS